ncbi:unnamed protein product, partial [Effrenium voratum]
DLARGSLNLQAKEIMQSMEVHALRAFDAYSSLAVMKWAVVSSFLSGIQSEVLAPEQSREGYSRQITATESAVLVGDLHGQLFALLAWLGKVKESYAPQGYSLLEDSNLFFCDERLQYVFMGDYVDRGERGTETTLLLLAYKALCPTGIIILQGNHEQRETEMGYGFAHELQHKFPTKGVKVWDLFTRVFEGLPYMAVSPGNFMATHGGLSSKFVAACEGGDFSTCLTKQLGDKMVWSDPATKNGFLASGRGGGLQTYGPDVTYNFLMKNNLRAIVRGHEQVQAGHRKQTIKAGYTVHTVFSSPDYCGLFCVGSDRMPVKRPAWDSWR